MYFFTCRLLGYVSHLGVIKPSPCLKNKNGAVSFSFEAQSWGQMKVVFLESTDLRLL